jgi:SAM-dependent methyltransferase
MLYRIDDADAFKRANLATWKANTEFWLQGRMRHLCDLDGFMQQVLARELLSRRPEAGTVMDVGCGEAWVLRTLRKLTKTCGYVGLDFNEEIIVALKTRHLGDANASFVVHDIEGLPPTALAGRADLLVCCFSLFEVPRLDQAIRCLGMLLARDGRLVVLSIEPLAQLIAISQDWGDLRANLAQYEKLGSHAAYDKDIDIGAAGSGRMYRGILYAVADYVAAAAAAGLAIQSIDRVVCTSGRVPQVYDAMVWRCCDDDRE